MISRWRGSSPASSPDGGGSMRRENCSPSPARRSVDGTGSRHRSPQSIQQLRSRWVQAIADRVQLDAAQHGTEPVHGVLEDRHPLGEIATEGLVGAGERARAEAELETTAAERVEDGGVLGDPDRVVERQDEHARTESDP